MVQFFYASQCIYIHLYSPEMVASKKYKKRKYTKYTRIKSESTKKTNMHFRQQILATPVIAIII